MELTVMHMLEQSCLVAPDLHKILAVAVEFAQFG